MDTKSLIVVKGEACGRLSPHTYALVSMYPARERGQLPSFSYHVFNAGSQYAGCAALVTSVSKNQVSADAVVASLRACTSPERVYIMADAFNYLKRQFTAPAVSFHLAKMVIPKSESMVGVS